MSIQALPEKLVGDQSQGLNFSQLKGDITLNQGGWQVSQLSIKSSELSAMGNGYGHLSTGQVNCWLDVQPHLTGSVPVIAAFAGGPVVGVASWLVNKLFVSPVVSSAVAQSFHISGQWPNIMVRKAHE